MIKKIIIEIDGKEICLSIEQAKKLQSELNSLMQSYSNIPSHYIHPWYFKKETTVDFPYMYCTTSTDETIGRINLQDSN